MHLERLGPGTERAQSCDLATNWAPVPGLLIPGTLLLPWNMPIIYKSGQMNYRGSRQVSY